MNIGSKYQVSSFGGAKANSNDNTNMVSNNINYTRKCFIEQYANQIIK